MQSSKKLHNKTKIAISFAIITCITLILFWFYNIHLQRVLENNICKTLDEITQQQKFSLNQTIEAHINKLENLAEIVVILDSDEQAILSSFNKLKANTNFDHIILSDTKGNGVSTDGERASIRDRAYFINSLAGENVISMPVISKTQGYAILPLSVPIHNNQGELMGVLMGGYNMEELNSFISPSFDGEGYAKIISSDGTIISMPEGSAAPLMVASSTDNNVFTGLESAQFIAYDTRADIIRKISEGKSGNSEYKMDNQTQFFSYSPLGINDWYIISIVTSDAIAADAHDILNKAILLTASVMAMLILVFFYIYLQQKKAEQMQKEYTDFLEEEQELNRIIITLSGDGYFVYDLRTGAMKHSELFAKKFDLPEVITNYPDMLFEKGIVAKESIEKIKNLFLGKSENDESVEEELHFIDLEGNDVWYRIHHQLLTDKDDIPYRAVGKITDITRHHVYLEHLREKAQIDQLTGLYNKATTEFLITTSLTNRIKFNTVNNQNAKCVLLIIDVDNFKSINDKLGHAYGDKVLSALGIKLKNTFRHDDIVGRIGGDEFFVFIENTSTGFIENKCQKLCALFRNTYSDKDNTVNISASIGVAFFPADGEDYEALYKNADIALYKAKEQGKNCFVFYKKPND